MKILTHEKTNTTADGIKRTFKPFFWPDMLKLGKLFPHINDVIPGANFLDLSDFSGIIEGAEKESKAYAALLDIISLLFSEKYCDIPLSKEKIEKADIINIIDIINLLKIATELAGLLPAAQDGEENPEAINEKKLTSKPGSKKTS